MSSIYKKGRDGYFYYQTYVYDRKTKKKNKKIFHSLGTKDKNIATEKKIELDQKYNKKNKSFIGGRKFLFSILILLNSVFVTFFLLKLSSEQNQNFENNFITNDSIYIEEKDEIVQQIVQKELLGHNIISTKISDIIIPNFIIQRVEKVSGSFKQGSVYLTVSGKPDQRQLKLLCNKVKKKYAQFTNIVVCVYSDTDNGLLLSKGESSNISTSVLEANWLAMYTFNPVEGEFFSDRPTAFLGGG
jgi:hypothetical protein